MSIEFQLETLNHPLNKSKSEKAIFTCKLSDPDKIKMLESLLSRETDKNDKYLQSVLFAIKNGECHFKFRKSGACVFYDHDFYVINDEKFVSVVFPYSEDIIFKIDLTKIIHNHSRG